MKSKTALAILLLFAATASAQEHMADTLRNGILEEDGKQNPTEAIKQYQAVLTQFAEARQTAATALFRMAECYRKQGNRNAAINTYQRVVNEFPDQPKLVSQSHTILATTYQTTPPAANGAADKAKYQQLMDESRQEQAKIAQARAAYRQTILDEIDLVNKQIVIADQRHNAGVANVQEGNNLRMKLLALKLDLTAFDAGLTSPQAKGRR
jgi:tetratricopeptide (TPR) repeat protein